jgi:hypothetical protein
MAFKFLGQRQLGKLPSRWVSTILMVAIGFEVKTISSGGFRYRFYRCWIVVASNAPVYTRCRLLGPTAPKPPVYRSRSTRCTSRRWRLLACPYWAGKEPPAEPHRRAHDDRRPYTASLLVVSKRALGEGRQRGKSAQVIPGRSRFGSLLLVDHRPSSLCHSAANELPVICIWWENPPFT